MSEKGPLHTHQDLIPLYLQADTQNPRPDRVVVKDHGYYIGWIVEFYHNLKEVESKKVTLTAQEYLVQENVIFASLAYYERNKEVIDSRIILNRAFYEPEHVERSIVQRAEQVLESSNGVVDPLLK